MTREEFYGLFTRLEAAEKALEAADAIRAVVPWVIAESERGLFNAFDAARAAHKATARQPDAPPHPTTFEPDDPNRGRECLRCGFAVPQGCRYVHADWCDAAHKATVGP